ncbi:virion structural protein [Pseudomonas phage Noxifer]|uniref:Virion structural protein n=1 Tax=Pseudomonas phage Noxifer TaxID=2006684 RepID=A0A1Y0SXC0_9CAUD|nr:virion structural protein [Pseudomonas phage Noxifer]ARV77254.1 virion structural protein [Pseudomonas phage Noxifer]
MAKETVSLELLNVKAKRRLGIRIEAVVEKWIERREFGSFYTSEQLLELQKIVKDEMGVNVEFVINNSPYINACVGVVSIPGHSGSTYRGPGTKPVTMIGASLPQQLRTIKIDLDKGKITGSMTDDFKNRMTLYAGLITDNDVRSTAGEITSVILHELGHVWNQYFALGDYVWLNYYLQEGVDVVMGKKPNIYKLEILTEAGLEKYGDKDALAAVKAAPTAKNVRRAILMAFQKAPRHHLISTDVDVSRLREEQLADIFASRMGYARESISFQVKIGKKFGNRYMVGSTAFVFSEISKVLLNMGALAGFGGAVAAGAAIGAYAIAPIAIIAIAMRLVALSMGYDSDSKIYDNDMERCAKFRLDLVAQLKVLGTDPLVREQLLEDIKMSDELTAIYRKNTTLYEAMQLVLQPESRRNRHQRAREEDIERLLNNDLFVAAAKFNTLSEKIK